jgi:hypothetical protein
VSEFCRGPANQPLHIIVQSPLEIKWYDTKTDISCEIDDVATSRGMLRRPMQVTLVISAGRDASRQEGRACVGLWTARKNTRGLVGFREAPSQHRMRAQSARTRGRSRLDGYVHIIRLKRTAFA